MPVLYQYVSLTGLDAEQAFHKVYEELSETYPGHILPAEDHQWIFMNAGGWMGSMSILHASLTEYVLLFGTGIDTSGNSGRFMVNIFIFRRKQM